MKRQHIGAVLVGAAFAALACRGDPTASLRGGAKFVDLSATVMFIDAGSAKSLSVVVRDEQQNPLAADVTVATLNAAVATVVVDTTVPSPNGSEHNYIISGVAPGATKIVVSSSGLSDTVAVSVLPLTFGGAILPTLTPKGGDTLKLASTAVLKFNAATTTVTFGGGKSPVVLSQTVDTIKMLVPFSNAGPLAVSNINVTFVSGLSVTLNTAQSVTQTGSLWTPADTGYATAPQIALPTTTGGKTFFITDMKGSYVNDADCGEGTGAGGIGKCAFFKYVANGTDSLSFSVDWEGAATNPDIDIYSCGSAGVSQCFEDNGSGATGSKPQIFRLKPTAGTHYYAVEVYAGTPPTNIVTTITKLN
ncbi:MAG TPA: hypothetical protein VNH63_00855 [Gemmatimonadales bacterium]|nr:hypothetical protein [Gemmatimonadales bacterium]